MKNLALSYISTAVVMLALDATWLTLTAGPLYRARIGALMLPKFAMAPVVVFYPVYVFGLVVFAVLPALTARSWGFALTRGALLGFIAYATYDLTNQATLRGWSPVITLADLTWGTVLSAVAATAGYTIVRAIA